jgi:murein DD-endopeptidase MepM/ murein hydrolase activator NlpD
MVLELVVIAYTPFREFIPGYPDETTRRNIIANVKRLDSLELELTKRDRYFSNLNKIFAGEEPENYETVADTATSYENIDFSRSNEDSILRSLIRREDYLEMGFVERNKSNRLISQVHFFTPLKGIVTNSFNIMNDHYGTDIVAATNEVVKAALAGTVTMANWTLETGYVIQVQHDNNIISVYKHNAELLKHVGDYVKVGEPIAIMGNSGELTTGPHLHFELWYKGTPLNPEDYISF